MEKSNIILIGMPACGKSTIGVLLAKTLGRQFIDTDLLIQSREGQLLQDIIDQKGLKAFLSAEERAILELDCTGAVIATGGSVVYSPAAMAHLKSMGITIYLELPYSEIERRLTNIKTRGVAMGKDETLHELYAERAPLYQHYADKTLHCVGLEMEQIVARIAKLIKTPGGE